MATEDALLLQNNLDVPLALKAPDALVLAQIWEREILRVWWGRECDLHDAGVFVAVKTTVRGVHALVGSGESFQDLKEVGQAQLRDVWAV